MEFATKLSTKGQRDFQLVQRALESSDQQAYNELMKNYRDSLYYMMLKMTGNPIDADDLTIEAFGKAFQNLKNYTPNYAFSTWLFRIATNNCIDYMRKKAKVDSAIRINKEETENKRSLQIPTSSPNPEEQFINDQKVGLMREVVQRLKPQYRRLIELRYFKEYSYAEIVEEVDMPLGTIKAQIFRARELMFQMLRAQKEVI
jgi:RNA polymerase sigma-70 factor (ECF subfamily)